MALSIEEVEAKIADLKQQNDEIGSQLSELREVREKLLMIRDVADAQAFVDAKEARINVVLGKAVAPVLEGQ
jgi:hypothetical protein